MLAAGTTRSRVQCTTASMARAHPGTWTICKTSRPRPGPVRPSSVPTGGKYALAKFVQEGLRVRPGGPPLTYCMAYAYLAN